MHSKSSYQQKEKYPPREQRNDRTTQALLQLTSSCGIAVRSFELRGTTTSIGNESLLGLMCASDPIRSVHRMGTSTTVRAEFESPRLPKCEYVVLLRQDTLLLIDRPLRCRHCGRFGHVSAVCKRPLFCLICGGSHYQDTCDAPALHCINCGKPHEATSFVCPQMQQECSVCRFRTAQHVSFVRACTAVTTRGGTGASMGTARELSSALPT